jgi:predicted amidohydrolase
MSAEKEKKPGELCVVVCQLTSINDVQKNSEQIQKLFSKIQNLKDVDVISLPENSLFMRMRDGDQIRYLDLHDPVWDFYKKFAKENDLMIHVGATPTMHDKQKWNATVLVMPDGSLQTPYQKVHLFDIHLENQKPFRESDLFEKGSKPHMMEFRGWRLGFTICYDIRFSELFMYYQKHEADVIFIPSAFLVETGKAHWEILNRARAIETQSYIVSAAQGGKHSEERATYGHSLVVDPWGSLITHIENEKEPGLKTVILKKNIIEKVRKQIPMKSHRRIKVEF